MVRRRATSLAVNAVTAVAVVLLSVASCASGDGGGGGGEDRSTGGADARASTSSSPAPPPPPSPTGPCADGSCEITVGAGDVVEVPEAYGLGPIEVTAVAGDEVEMVAPVHGSGYSIAGCSGGGGVTSHGGGGVRLRCGEGPAATLNDVMSLEVVEVRGRTAVLRIAPAS
ncbi:hypothetical protein [Streptomyces sp. MA15]|uniref:hypothetical protein n=1 Tax=Streptomyces sp. MA15 TaxID=3055061 RepID=UPI0025AF5690|nr:hypothetical protein [Streptomyces sp. MA15]MDN3270404.1 hypothetical protein [Streptomyces sp. MA15]